MGALSLSAPSLVSGVLCEGFAIVGASFTVSGDSAFRVVMTLATLSADARSWVVVDLRLFPLPDVALPSVPTAFRHPTPFLVRIGVLSSLVTPAVCTAFGWIATYIRRLFSFPIEFPMNLRLVPIVLLC